MPPKKAAAQGKGKAPEPKPKKDPSKKVADATFGLKNKNRSTKVQTKIKQIEQNANSTNSKEAKRQEVMRKRREEEKKAAEQAKAEVSALFNAIPKKNNGEQYVNRKEEVKESQKIDLYSDVRDIQTDLPPEKRPWVNTDIVCKFFLEACEQGKYGWLWQCPNGNMACIYKHSLPRGYVLARDKKKGDNEKEEISLEAFIEIERYRLGTNLTRVTEENFKQWCDKRKDRLAKEAEERRKNRPTGRGNMTGREFFQRNKGKVKENLDIEGEENWDFSALRRETEALRDTQENDTATSAA
ncbi:mRNA export protein Mep33 [Schizosaccharomyces cryophilus OY26]|uniref:mRNA export protein Mep33 n=1 Tax=Schizosaccharomyces cryophilus (strain OY26 / ATCC MYA-4695 / CBS 11777 / NBRC 106824 / NRRL Y48691) TaxID=653667 RepID=S9WWQ8_SCHCR|nr:mRNA export protein Mep33 [Schizosaccharomyces cryophilus OY26]EPY49177.1 mRNA export protein Mep33 [Schizosaccharomyces cryophilus OY26]